MSDDACAEPPDQASERAGLVLVSTPIGNLGDLSPRARDELAGADVILCEDTRRAGEMLRRFSIRGRLLSLHDHNEDARIAGVLDMLRTGQRVALISDAGTPVLSDPGFRLMRAVIEADLPVTAAPGPNAAVTALVLSGLPPLPFLFLGFPPPRRAARQAAFLRLRELERAGLTTTLVWYEAPHRLAETLADMAEAFGDRPAAVARELTKRFEEVRRASLIPLAAHYAANPARGEISIVLGPAPEETPDEASLDEALRQALATQSLRDAVDHVAQTTGVPRRIVYARALALRG